MKKLVIASFIIFLASIFTGLLISCSSSGLSVRGLEKDDHYKIGDTGPGGGIVFYINPDPKSDEFRYLEVAPEVQGVQIAWGDCFTGKIETSTEYFDSYSGDYASEICRTFRSTYVSAYQCRAACERDYIKGSSQYNRCVLSCTTCFTETTTTGSRKVENFDPNTRSELFAGKNNTELILEACGKKKSAAKIASLYRGGGKNDWFLPSNYALEIFYQNMSGLNMKNISMSDKEKSILYWSSTESPDNKGEAYFLNIDNGRVLTQVWEQVGADRFVKAGSHMFPYNYYLENVQKNDNETYITLNAGYKRRFIFNVLAIRGFNIVD